MFTGAAARILIEEGKLDTEDPVSKYFSDVPESCKAMKVRHLLTMSTGFKEDWGNDDLIPYSAEVLKPSNDADMLKMFYEMKPAAPIGTEYHYSSPAFAMLGMIVSKISGQPLSKFIDEHIFQPAEMTESSFIDNWAIIPEKAEGYRMKDGQILKGWYLGHYLHERPDVGILTTVGDFAKWIICLEQGKIVKEPQKLWMASVADSGRPLDYSYGWITDTVLGHRRFQHSGGLRTGFHTFVAKYPDDDLTVIAFTNCDFSNPDRFVLITTIEYLKGLPDPGIETTKPDADRAGTAELIETIKQLSGGKIDAAHMNSDALEPLGLQEVSEFMKSVKSIAFAGRRTLSNNLQIHNHTLTRYETLKVSFEEGDYFLTVYYDDHNKIAYIEATG